jgi:hypothetical protein
VPTNYTWFPQACQDEATVLEPLDIVRDGAYRDYGVVTLKLSNLALPSAKAYSPRRPEA